MILNQLAAGSDDPYLHALYLDEGAACYAGTLCIRRSENDSSQSFVKE
jgi:hypothetical protein